MSRYAFGVDVGGTTVKLGLFSESGELLEKWEIPTVTENAGAQILSDVADAIRAKVTQMGIRDEDVLGVGMGVPGSVEDNGWLHVAVNLGWKDFSIPEAFGKYLSYPFRVSNDANVAAFGEMLKGGGKGAKNVVAVTLGTGVGGGIIIDGRIVNGATGAGGEIGHIHIQDGEDECCNCGQRGCLEQYTSATGIVRLAKRRLAKDGAPSVLREGEISAKSVFEAVKEKDAVAMEIAEQFGEYLGKGLGIIASVVNPERFVIGGGVSRAGEILFDYIRPNFEKYSFVATLGAEFALAELGNDAGIYGAAGLILNP